MARRQVGEALLRPDVSTVGHPYLVRRLHVERPIQGVVDDDRRLAAKLAGTALVANLCLDASQPGQPGDTVRADAFALFEQVIMQLALLGTLLRNALSGRGYPWTLPLSAQASFSISVCR